MCQLLFQAPYTYWITRVLPLTELEETTRNLIDPFIIRTNQIAIFVVNKVGTSKFHIVHSNVHILVLL